MKYFTQGYFDFFAALSENNNAEWFRAHKSEYEQQVRQPFLSLTHDLMDVLRGMGKQFDFEPKAALFRINRDIRFSKNKEPYKLHMSAFISSFGKKSPGMPGFYFQAGHDELMAGGGVYDPNPYQLHRIRWHILHQPEIWQKATQEKSFQKIYGEILGERNKILPTEYKDAVKEIPVLANKQYYYMHKIGKSEFLSNKLLSKLTECIEAARPIEELILKAYQE